MEAAGSQEEAPITVQTLDSKSHLSQLEYFNSSCAGQDTD